MYVTSNNSGTDTVSIESPVDTVAGPLVHHPFSGEPSDFTVSRGFIHATPQQRGTYAQVSDRFSCSQHVVQRGLAESNSHQARTKRGIGGVVFPADVITRSPSQVMPYWDLQSVTEARQYCSWSYCTCTSRQPCLCRLLTYSIYSRVHINS